MPSPTKEPPTETPTARSNEATTTAAPPRAVKEEDCSFISASTEGSDASFTKCTRCFECGKTPVELHWHLDLNELMLFEPDCLPSELETSPSEILPTRSFRQINQFSKGEGPRH